MRKHTFLLLLSLWGASPLCAQEPKGAAPLATHHSSLITHHSTRAVVVGISDYQDPAIPDLQYAHRDAEAFAAWLQSPAGGSVPAENIQVLLNEKATMGRVAMALWALMTHCVEGDQAIIYFSGHGDVETKTIAQPGYWLCWDSPPYAYMSGGCFNVRDLQDIVATLSRQNKARVLVISDACHAGKLAGSDIGGPQATAQNLARQFASEVKILSCQPNEFSLEGAQWGGGRGCFSYHLTDGLYGLADRNEDDLVTLVELENYLEDRVPEETAPHRQFPFTVGDKLARLARVDAPTLARIKAGKAGAQPSLEPIDPRGMEDWVLARADSSIRELYAAFNAALERGELMASAEGGKSADDYYRRLIREPELAPVHGLMTRNFAAALVDESQQVTNKLLKSDPQVVSDAWSRPFVFDHIPAYLQRAIELLGKQHFLYRHLMAKLCYFEAKTYRPDAWPEIASDSLVTMMVGKMQQGLQFDSSAAYILVELSQIYFYKRGQFAEAAVYAEEALTFSPNSVLAHYIAGNSYRNTDQNRAVYHLERAIELDSTFLLPYHELHFVCEDCIKGDLYLNKYIQKVQYLLTINPEQVPIQYQTLLGGSLYFAGRLEEAEIVLRDVIQHSMEQDWVAIFYLGMTLFAMNKYEEALATAEKTFEHIPYNPSAHDLIIRCYFKLNRPTEFVRVMERIASLHERTETFWAYYAAILAVAYNKVGRTDDANALFQNIIDSKPIPDNPYEMNILCRSYFGLGDREAMEHLIQESQLRFERDPWVYYQIGCVYSLANEVQKALYWLEKAFENNFTSIPEQFDFDQDWDNIRDSSGFKSLMKKYYPGCFKD